VLSYQVLCHTQYEEQNHYLYFISPRMHLPQSSSIVLVLWPPSLMLMEMIAHVVRH
jgi:hypothetical protein